EDPAPRHVGDDQPAEHHAENSTDGPAEGSEAVSAATLFARIEVGYHRTAVRHDQRAADALDDAEHDDRHIVPGKRAQERADDEHSEARLIHPDPAEHVAEPANLRREQRDDEQE